MATISLYTKEMTDSFIANGHWTRHLTIDFCYSSCRLYPNKIAFADDSMSYTWAQSVDIIDKLASSLIDIQIPRDGMILVQSPNSVFYVFLRLACEKAGIIPVFLHIGFRGSEIREISNRLKPIGAIFSANPKHNLLPIYQELREELGLEYLISFEKIDMNIISINELINEQTNKIKQRRIQPFGMTGIVTSSGTTGSPKCIEYSCWPRLASARVYIDRLNITASDIILTCIPFYTGGGDMQFHVVPQIGATLILQSHFSPELTCQRITMNRVSGAVMVPTMIARIAALANLKEYNFSSLRWVVSGGSMLSPDIAKQFEVKTGAKIIQGYGLMDCGAIASHSITDSEEERFFSNGKLLPGVEIQIINEAGAVLLPHERGEICVKGPYLSGSYINNSFGDETVWHNGYFKTGDIGKIDKDGYLILEGRSKDIIIRGGQNISIFEVSSILATHPAVLDATLVALPDAEFGERACAFIILKQGSKLTFEEMQAFMKLKEIAKYKIPERLQIVSQFPMTAAGNKIDRAALRDSLESEAQRSLPR